MVSTRKKRQSNRRILSQIGDFNRNIIIGNAVSGRQGNFLVNEGTVDQEFTVNKSSRYLAANENLVKVKILARFFNERIDMEMGTIVDSVEDRIQNAILTAIFCIIFPKIE